MSLQLIKDENGKDAGVFVPINEWNEIIKTHSDLKALLAAPASPRKKLSELAGKLSAETANAMQQYIANSRREWDERLSNQLSQ